MKDKMGGCIEHMRAKGIFSSIDVHFAKLMAELGGGEPTLFLASALLSSQTRMGHVCLDIQAFAGKILDETGDLRCPPLKQWIDSLTSSLVVGGTGDQTPLVLDGQGRLYLRRYFEYQRILGEFILEKARQPLAGKEDLSVLKEGLVRLFGDNGTSKDEQKTAACVSCLHRFSVISGGPGTGKTTTVARLLVLCIEQHLARASAKEDGVEPEPFSICLCAPTGKAAMRLKESLGVVLSGMAISDVVRRMIPDNVKTIHRMLGTVRHSPYFRYNRDNRLPADLVVVDEASMVDLALMSKLVSALAPETSLVLLGDKDQLASVEAGSVLGDICGPPRDIVVSGPLARSLERLTGHGFASSTESLSGTGVENLVTVLTRSYRFDDQSGIGAVSRAVNAGEGGRALGVLENPEYSDVTLEGLPEKAELKDSLKPIILAAFGQLMGCSDALEAFRILDTFRVLCAVREGVWGVYEINRLVAEIFRDEFKVDTRQEWYPGRPVVVVKNDYTLKLFNGDVGITVRDHDANGRMKVIFPSNDGGLKSFVPDQLPDHETAYAMTVHKSQGSEFDHVLLILPGRDNPVLTRELVYTGITRAKRQVTVMADSKIWLDAVERKISRRSGLRDILWPKARENA